MKERPTVSTSTALIRAALAALDDTDTPARTILQAALEDADKPTTAEQHAARQPRGNGHNNPTTKEQRDRNHEGGTTLSRRLAAKQRYLTEKELM
jgi:hypothetical protein